MYVHHLIEKVNDLDNCDYLRRLTHPLDGLTVGLAGGYQIEREIGSGGMASVSVARDVEYVRSASAAVSFDGYIVNRTSLDLGAHDASLVGAGVIICPPARYAAT